METTSQPPPLTSRSPVTFGHEPTASHSRAKTEFGGDGTGGRRWSEYESGSVRPTAQNQRPRPGMDPLLTRLRDFSCRTSTFQDCRREVFKETGSPMGPCGDAGGGCRDIQSALAWLRRELMELRSQDQALVRQLMELHSGIQELKQELEQEEEEDEEEGCYGGARIFSNSGGMSCLDVHQKPTRPPFTGALLERVFYRRSSVP
ncbi:hypothetical protein OJAV_G00114540 [Oryzias javanicus]|uniref:Uncharacterized protein n=1 Tax=Oryzias javanicus TaxID=123683 RepID=A0A437CX14_ORYJA|nr:hypothetical protein OJAV_G00114540 [Oryzias javanicus]